MAIIDNGDEYRLEIIGKYKDLTIEEDEDGKLVIKIYDKNFDKSMGVYISGEDVKEIIEFLGTYEGYYS